MNRRYQICLTALLAALLAALFFSSCGKEEPEEPAATSAASEGNMAVVLPGNPGSFGTAGEQSTPAPDALDAIGALIDEGRYYEAFREMLLYEEKHTDAASRAACEALFDRLKPLLQENEPRSGTELMRTFRYYGGCELQAVANSGPLLITVTDAGMPEDPTLMPAYSRFYVRKGETGTIHLPAGVYHVSYQVGYLWFDDDIGFGDYWNGGELDRNLTFEVEAGGSVTNNSRYTLTF